MDDEGFLSMDALVALTLTSLGLVIVLQAYGGALALNRRTTDHRANIALAVWVLQTQWPRLARPGDIAGRASEGRSWRIQAQQTDGYGDHLLCAVKVEIGGQRHSSYRLRTLDFCGAER
jgi:type II secretory pathway component PulJ